MTKKSNTFTFEDVDFQDVVVVEKNSDKVYHLSFFDIQGVSQETIDNKEVYCLYYTIRNEKDRELTIKKIIIDGNTAFYLAMLLRYVTNAIEENLDGVSDDIS